MTYIIPTIYIDDVFRFIPYINKVLLFNRTEIKRAGFKYVSGRGHTAIISRDDVAADRGQFIRDLAR